MDFLKRLRDQVNPFDGGKTFNSPQQRQAPLAEPQRGPARQLPQPMESMRSTLQPKQHFAEDDGYVSTPMGMRPLSTLDRDTPWRNLQNGYSPPGRSFGAEDDAYVETDRGMVPMHSLDRLENLRRLLGR